MTKYEALQAAIDAASFSMRAGLTEDNVHLRDRLESIQQELATDDWLNSL